MTVCTEKREVYRHKIYIFTFIGTILVYVPVTSKCV